MRRTGLGLFMVCALMTALAMNPAASAEQGQLTIGPTFDVTALTLNLNRGIAVDFSWSANGSVDFRIENEAGTITFVDRSGQVGSGTFDAPADGAFTFGFRNRNDFPITVQWTINSRLPMTVLASLIAGVLVAGGVAAIFLIRRRRRKPTSDSNPGAN